MPSAGSQATANSFSLMSMLRALRTLPGATLTEVVAVARPTSVGLFGSVASKTLMLYSVLGSRLRLT